MATDYEKAWKELRRDLRQLARDKAKYAGQPDTPDAYSLQAGSEGEGIEQALERMDAIEKWARK